MTEPKKLTQDEIMKLSVAEQIAYMAEQEDHVTETSYTRELPAAGPCFVKLVEYVELGLQPTEYKGVHSDKSQVRLGFELVSPNHKIELDDGKRIPNMYRPYPMTLSTSAKGQFKKLFNAMRGTDESIKSMYQLVGKTFLAEVTHDYKNKGTDKEKIYMSLKVNKEWSLKPAVQVIPDANGALVSTPMNVPVSATTDADIIVLSQKNPLKIMWDKLFIDGEKEDGTSKNFIQEEIMGATNFDGSPLQQLLGGVEGLMKTDNAEAPVPVQTPVQAAPVPATPAPAVTPQVPAEKPAEVVPDVAVPAIAEGEAAPTPTTTEAEAEAALNELGM